MEQKKISLKKKIITFASAIMLSLVSIGATSFSVSSAESSATTEITTESNAENLKSADCDCGCCDKSNKESVVTVEVASTVVTTTNEPETFEIIVGLILIVVFIIFIVGGR